MRFSLQFLLIVCFVDACVLAMPAGNKIENRMPNWNGSYPATPSGNPNGTIWITPGPASNGSHWGTVGPDNGTHWATQPPQAWNISNLMEQVTGAPSWNNSDWTTPSAFNGSAGSTPGAPSWNISDWTTPSAFNGSAGSTPGAPTWNISDWTTPSAFNGSAGSTPAAPVWNNTDWTTPNYNGSIGSTPASQNLSACAGVIFLGEMTSYIPYFTKMSYYNTINNLAQSLNHDFSFAFGLYGNGIYNDINLTSYDHFMDVFRKYNVELQNNKPNGNKNYLTPVMSSLLKTIKRAAQSNYAVVIMGENNHMQDPGKAASVAKIIATTNANIYAIDVSSDTQASAFWQVLTGNKPGNVINANLMNFDDITSYLNSTIVRQINSLC